MAEIFYFYVQDDRTIAFHSPEPIMQEDKDVAVWKFRIPKALNQTDMSNWAWWFVYTNAKGQKFSKELMLGPDYDEPDIYNSAEISIDHGISIYPGNITFALEAINAVAGGGEIIEEWHTYTYTHKVVGTLQGNQAEYAETEHDIISALITEYQNLHVGTNQITDGAVTFAKLANDAVTSIKLADGAVTNAKLATNSVSTANVQDGAITEAKLADSLKLKTIKDYVTPEMFGAVGDGVTDDTSAIQSAINSGKPVFFDNKTYAISSPVTLNGSIELNNDTTIKALNTMTAMFVASSVGDRLRFSKGIIDCNGLAETGINLTNCNGAYVRDVKVLNALNASINISGGNHNWIIGCKLYNPNTLAGGIVNDSPDLKVSDCEIYYTSCGIQHDYGIIFISNTHIWSGGATNVSTTSVGIKSSTPTNPRIFGNNVYLDSFYIGLDIGSRVGIIKLSESLFYWATTTTPQNCYGIRAGVNSDISLEGCFFQTYSPIVKNDILYGSQVLNYSDPKSEITSAFSITSNASVTILTVTLYKNIMHIDFVLKILDLTADSTTWYPVLESIAMPPVKMVVNRLDFAGFNLTKKQGIVCRIGPYTADNIIRMHINGDIAVGNVVYGSVGIPVI